MIRLESVCKQHSGRILFLDASMTLFRGERIGLVGPNGAGKSTMVLVSHDRSVLRGLSNRVLEMGGEDGPRQYDGGYAEYVTAMGYEAPGVR